MTEEDLAELFRSAIRRRDAEKRRNRAIFLASVVLFLLWSEILIAAF